VGTPPGKVKLVVSQRNVAPAALGTMLPKASSTSDRVNGITNLKLDFTMHLLYQGIAERQPPPKYFLPKATPEN
jgi:hypothetical protein